MKFKVSASTIIEDALVIGVVMLVKLKALSELLNCIFEITHREGICALFLNFLYLLHILPSFLELNVVRVHAERLSQVLLTLIHVCIIYQ